VSFGLSCIFAVLWIPDLTNRKCRVGLVVADLSKTNKLKCRPTTVDDGSHNVSRWMTWLPISLKNAAKCDKWYQLQNHSITESLNANGMCKHEVSLQLHICHLQCRTKTKNYQIAESVLDIFERICRCSGSFCAHLCGLNKRANQLVCLSYFLSLLKHRGIWEFEGTFFLLCSRWYPVSFY
jgi:hypothetical protein